MSETIGQQLKKTREARNLTVKKVTQSTHIQARFLEAIEADDFDSLPSPVQARAFLRLYAEFLGLSLDDLIARQRTEAGAPPASLHDTVLEPDESSKPDKTPNPAETVPVKKPLKDKLLLLQAKSKDLILHIRKSIRKPQKTSIPSEPIIIKTPSEPEDIPNTQVKPERGVVEEPISEAVEELLPTIKSASGFKSQVIFTSIGKTLLDHRQALSLTLDEIEDHTHVRKHYLLALEAGDFDNLPSSVQARGMLNNYARFLDMDVDAILLRFAEGLQAQRLERQPNPADKNQKSDRKSPSKAIPPHGLRRYFTMDVFVGVGLILLLLVFAIWGTTRVVGLRSASTPQPTAQPISDILAFTPQGGTTSPAPTNESGTGVILPEASSTAIVTLPATGQGPVQIVIVALEQAFVRVTVDGKKVFEGRVNRGGAYPFDGNNQIEVLTGNGAALSILFNQSNLGPMGSIGEVVDRIYTTNAILNPTPTITPTPTLTPTPTVTPRPTATPRPGSTPQLPTATQVPG